MYSPALPIDDRASGTQDEDKNLIAIADHCVACGLCLPHCPTYRKTLSEADSPRGRIALMRGVLERQIPINTRFIEHIDLCLTCRACERACPNHVAYGNLVDGMRVIIETKRNSRFLHKLALRHLLTRPRLLEAIGTSLRWYRNMGAQTMVRKSGLLKLLGLENLDRYLPPITPRVRWRARYPAREKQSAAVGLFLGCVARITDSETLQATIYVLNRLGYTVVVPKNQNCCGALQAHSGEQSTALQLAEQNVQAFGDLNTIVSTASGCGAHLGEYKRLLGEPASMFSARVVDINTFLCNIEAWENIEFAPLKDKVVVHDPCTLRNVLRQESFPYQLLKHIPGAEIKPLPGSDQCCGAAGNYFLHHPEMATTLLSDKMEALKTSGAQYLVTSNVGCAMYLRSGLVGDASIEVLHPITLLARQMGFKC